jgi:hypothetical protein
MRILKGIFVSSFLVAAVWAQSGTSTLSGSVKDPPAPRSLERL